MKTVQVTIELTGEEARAMRLAADEIRNRRPVGIASEPGHADYGPDVNPSLLSGMSKLAKALRKESK